MGSLETLASWTVSPHDDYETVKVLHTARNDVLVKCHHIEWQGSVVEWQAALLTALSAKFVEGTLVIETPRLVSHDAMTKALETAKEVEESTKRTVVLLGPCWRSMPRDEAEQALRALAPLEYYPQLTDWVRAQPSGTSNLAVFQKDEQQHVIRRGDNDGKLLWYIIESELVETLASGREYSAVWLSRDVDPSCEAKVPRGVKVYRER